MGRGQDPEGVPDTGELIPLDLAGRDADIFLQRRPNRGSCTSRQKNKSHNDCKQAFFWKHAAPLVKTIFNIYILLSINKIKMKSESRFRKAAGTDSALNKWGTTVLTKIPPPRSERLQSSPGDVLRMDSEGKRLYNPGCRH
jgi:hypothetical protein